jgi:malonate transporter and related proteins
MRVRSPIDGHAPPAKPAMLDVIALSLPFFGMILVGFVCGRFVAIAEEGMHWMNFFIVYVALPPLFFKLVAETPVADLANGGFILATTLSTLIVYLIAYGVGLRVGPDRRAAAIQGVLGAYSNIGYMGPGLTLATLGPAAATPTALIFVFDNILIFALTPLLIGLAESGSSGLFATIRSIVVKVVTHPFNIATALGVLSAWSGVKPPHAIDQVLISVKNAAAPVALFALGVTVALRPTRGFPTELAIHLPIKLVLHPLLVWVLLSLIADAPPVWVYTAMLMAALPPALNVFVMARQYQAYVDQASRAILIGTLISTISLTVLMYLVSHAYLPADLFP